MCGHIPSSLATAFITLLSQLQTKPQCGASLLKGQHDKNSRIEVAQPTFPWHMVYFLLRPACVVDCDRTLVVGSVTPQTHQLPRDRVSDRVPWHPDCDVIL